MKKFIKLTLIVSVMARMPIALGNTFQSANKGQVTFVAIGKPSFLEIKGTGEAPKGQIILGETTIKGDYEFNLKSLDTGMDLRNDHMKNKYLKVEEASNGVAKLQILKISSAQPKLLIGKLAEGSFDGLLNLKGVQKNVQGTFKVTNTDSEKSEIESQFKIKLSDFNIEIPSFAGITVADEVQITVKDTLVKMNDILKAR